MIPRLILAVAALASIGAARADDSKVWQFDFGTTSSKVRDGFTKVTEQTEFTVQRGYGFRSTKGLVSRTREGWQFGPAGRESSYSTHDFVEGSGDAVFSLQGGHGRFVVWVVVSDRHEAPPWFAISCNGERAREVRVPRRGFVWLESFEVEANNGVLDIALRGEHGFIINALVIGSDASAIGPVIAALQRDLFFLPPEQQERWKPADLRPTDPPFQPTKKEEKEGVVVFASPYSVPIFPDSVPRREQVGRSLRTFATLGEIEPASCCVLALRDLGSVAVDVSDLTEESGVRIARRQIEIGVVRCWPQRVKGGMESSGTYMLKPELIEVPTARNSAVVEGECKQWWLTLRVPATAKPGLYRGTVRIRPQRGDAQRLEWLVRVLPFSLDPPQDRHWGTWWDGATPPMHEIRGPLSRGRNTPAERDAYSRVEMDDFRDHGFDVAILDCSYDIQETRRADGSWTFTLGPFSQRMDRLKQLKAPFAAVASEYFCRRMEHRYAEDKPHVEGTFSEAARSACVSLFRFLDAEARRNGWPPIIHMPIDEPTNGKTANRMRFARQVLEMVGEAGGQAGCTLTAAAAASLGDRVRTRIYAWGHFNVPRARRAAEDGFAFWYYHNGMLYGESTLRSRGMTGFEFYRSGAQCATGWGFSAYRGNPHNDFDSSSQDWFVVLPGARKPTPTIYWELCREGVDDVRYITTLRNAIEATDTKDPSRVRAAERVLEGILAGDEIVRPEVFARLRWRLAEQVLSLKEFVDAPPAFVSERRSIDWGENLFSNSGWESGRAEHCYLSHPAALTISGETAHVGQYSLRFSGAEAAGGPGFRGQRYLVVNVPVPKATAQQLAGKFVKVGLWLRIEKGVLALGGARLRSFKTGEDGKNVYLGGVEGNSGVEDPTVWNRLEGAGVVHPETQWMDLHLSCALPEDKIRRDDVLFYIDDLFLQALTRPPLNIELRQDDWFVGEPIRWTLDNPSGVTGLVVSLVREGTILRRVQVPAGMRPTSTLSTEGLGPGIYTIAATGGQPGKTVESRREIYLAASPFDEPDG